MTFQLPRLELVANALGQAILYDPPLDVATALVLWDGADMLDGKAAMWLRDVAAALDAGRMRQ